MKKLTFLTALAVGILLTSAAFAAIETYNVYYGSGNLAKTITLDNVTLETITTEYYDDPLQNIKVLKNNDNTVIKYEYFMGTQTVCQETAYDYNTKTFTRTFYNELGDPISIDTFTDYVDMVDGLGRVITRFLFNEDCIYYTYYGETSVVSVLERWSSDGKITTENYDTEGRLVSYTENWTGITYTVTAYDAEGRAATLLWSDGRWEERTYQGATDVIDRRQIYYSADSAYAFIYGYDDPGMVTSYTYDASGRVIRADYSTGSYDLYSYSGVNGDAASVQCFHYDDTLRATYFYDADGLIQISLRPDTQWPQLNYRTIYSVYDELGRVVRIDNYETGGYGTYETREYVGDTDKIAVRIQTLVEGRYYYRFEYEYYAGTGNLKKATETRCSNGTLWSYVYTYWDNPYLIFQSRDLPILPPNDPDPNPHTCVRYEYNEQGRLIKAIELCGDYSTAEYYPSGNPRYYRYYYAGEVDPYKIYELWDIPHSFVHYIIFRDPNPSVDGDDVLWEFDTECNLIKRTLDNGYYYTREYQGWDLYKERYFDPSGVWLKTTQFWPNGNKHYEWILNGVEGNDVYREYNEAGQLLRVNLSTGYFYTYEYQGTTLYKERYFAPGWVWQKTTEYWLTTGNKKFEWILDGVEGHDVYREYREDGLIQYRMLSNNYYFTYEYDAGGNLIATREYDNQNRLIKMTLGTGYYYTYEYQGSTLYKERYFNPTGVWLKTTEFWPTTGNRKFEWILNGVEGNDVYREYREDGLIQYKRLSTNYFYTYEYQGATLYKERYYAPGWVWQKTTQFWSTTGNRKFEWILNGVEGNEIYREYNEAGQLLRKNLSTGYFYTYEYQGGILYKERYFANGWIWQRTSMYYLGAAIINHTWMIDPNPSTQGDVLHYEYDMQSRVIVQDFDNFNSILSQYWCSTGCKYKDIYFGPGYAWQQTIRYDENGENPVVITDPTVIGENDDLGRPIVELLGGGDFKIIYYINGTLTKYKEIFFASGWDIQQAIVYAEDGVTMRYNWVYDNIGRLIEETNAVIDQRVTYTYWSPDGFIKKEWMYYTASLNRWEQTVLYYEDGIVIHHQWYRDSSPDPGDIVELINDTVGRVEKKIFDTGDYVTISYWGSTADKYQENFYNAGDVWQATIEYYEDGATKHYEWLVDPDGIIDGDDIVYIEYDASGNWILRRYDDGREETPAPLGAELLILKEDPDFMAQKELESLMSGSNVNIDGVTITSEMAGVPENPLLNQ